MSLRKTPFIKGEIYHIYNRGIEKRIIFEDKQDFSEFLDMMKQFNDKNRFGGRVLNKRLERQGKTLSREPWVDILAYCLLPNHFHFILREEKENGISKFMQKLGTGYTMYFNKKNKRSGSLFQGKFKSKHIKSQTILEYLSVYVNLNFEVHKASKTFLNSNEKNNNLKKQDYRSSWSEYIADTASNTVPRLCNTEYVLKSFSDHKEYQKYALRQLAVMLEKKHNEKKFRI